MHCRTSRSLASSNADSGTVEYRVRIFLGGFGGWKKTVYWWPKLTVYLYWIFNNTCITNTSILYCEYKHTKINTNQSRTFNYLSFLLLKGLAHSLFKKKICVSNWIYQNFLNLLPPEKDIHLNIYIYNWTSNPFPGLFFVKNKKCIGNKFKNINNNKNDWKQIFSQYFSGCLQCLHFQCPVPKMAFFLCHFFPKKNEQIWHTGMTMSS